MRLAKGFFLPSIAARIASSLPPCANAPPTAGQPAANRRAQEFAKPLAPSKTHCKHLSTASTAIIHYQTATLPYCHTVILSHCHTITLLLCHSLTLPHCHTVTLPHYHTTTLPLSHSITLPHCHTETATLPDHYTITLSYRHISTLARSRTVAPSQYHTATRLLCIICLTVSISHFILLDK